MPPVLRDQGAPQDELSCKAAALIQFMECIEKRMHPYAGNSVISWKYPNKLCLCILLLYSILLLTHHFYMMQQHNSAGSLYNFYIQKHRRAIVNLACLQKNLNNSMHSITTARSLFVEHSHKFIYCEVPKVGCSNWKRVIILLKLGSLHNAQDLTHEEVHKNRLLYQLSDYSVYQQKKMLNSYTKVMFARHPFQRLVSAYRDKILHPQPYYSEVVKSIKFKVRERQNFEGDLTFEEFVRFILQQDPKKMDIHWKPMHYICDPCNIQYDIYGKLETMELDAAYVLRSIKAPFYLKYPGIKHYPNESTTDEIIGKEYFKSLSKLQLQGLAEIYYLDFVMFEYNNFYENQS
ncbi:carbohydrate sulfotransferase 8-like [Rhinoderma darwinii]|uniref:carbohydrate sulfotransferase 8-like n=1 Tax=Rhinoderma darwinii TaxID=43563 RepID=UPI003F6690B7